MLNSDLHRNINSHSNISEFLQAIKSALNIKAAHKKDIKSKAFPILGVAFLCCVIIFSMSTAAYADTCTPEQTNYELPEGSDYSAAENYTVNEFTYGKDSLGVLTFSGSISSRLTYSGWDAYSVSGPVSFGYQYDGSYQTEDKDAWNLASDSGKDVNGLELSRRVKSGVIVIQKSPDGVNWENAVEPVTDFFNDNPEGSSSLYTTPEEEIMNGMYYRITVGYTMARRITSEKIVGFISKDEYEYTECAEIYKCYIESGKNYITFHDMLSRSELSNNSSADSGFYIQKNGSSDSVKIRKDGGNYSEVKDYEYFINPGKYEIEITSTLGEKSLYVISVSQGLEFTALKPDVFENEKDEGFLTDKTPSAETVFGKSSLTELSIATTTGSEITEAEIKGCDAYGVTGSSTSLFLNVRGSENNVGNGWNIEYDNWGKRKRETIQGSMTGEIGKGALIVQTSEDGVSWEDAALGRYAEGLYTTDFTEHYGMDENVLIYTPSGDDIINGVYIRVFFAYQVHNESKKENVDYLEQYQFYLCSSELKAVAIHNLSAEGLVEKTLGDADEKTVQIYKKAETMRSGDCTTSGFYVDTELNPAATYSVEKDGIVVPSTRNKNFTETGRYDIHIKSAVGDKKDIVIYVDRDTENDAMLRCFGDGFLDGKRIFAEGEYPVYEGGHVKYNISAVSENYLPLCGTIKNLTSGSAIAVPATRSAKCGTITEPGSYEAVLTTAPDYNTNDASGDARVFTFRFTVIAEGTAPGPVINQRSLNEYAHSTVVDSCPIYYGLTYQSASKGYITLAFATREAALDYAYNYEKGMVEKQADGTYRYNGAFRVPAQKSRYDSNWDLTDAVNYFAQQAVQTLYFDMSDKFTYLSLSPETVKSTDNLRTQELSSSVVLFADGQKELLTDTGSLPIINDKPYSYLDPDTGSVSEGLSCFQFVTDNYGGIDSRSVVVTDCQGTEYAIRYSESVGQQLEKSNCAGGIISIKETTLYGDTAEYEAIYISPGASGTAYDIVGYSESGNETVTISAGDDGKELTLNSFGISSIRDELDPCSLLIVRDGQREFFYTAGADVKDIWSEPGDYTISCVNRMGYGYTVNVHLTESDNAVIRFDGEGTEELPNILTRRGAKNLELPELSKYGYDFLGFTDSTGSQVFSEKIPLVSFSGENTFTSLWRAKQVSISLQAPTGSTMETINAEFGESCELPLYKETEYGSITGWKRNGELLSANIITVNSEDDIVLTACVNSDAQECSPESEENRYSGMLVILLIICAVIAAVVFVFKKRLYGRKSRNVGDDSYE